MALTHQEQLVDFTLGRALENLLNLVPCCPAIRKSSLGACLGLYSNVAPPIERLHSSDSFGYLVPVTDLCTESL